MTDQRPRPSSTSDTVIGIRRRRLDRSDRQNREAAAGAPDMVLKVRLDALVGEVLLIVATYRR